MEKISNSTPDLTQENIDKLAELFPDVITEVENEDGEIVRAVDIDALKDDLGCAVAEGRRERYQFTWPGKAAAKEEARRPINKTLRPCKEESVDWEATENLYIEGDNLDALKLLRDTYAGRVKMIYIDPPYNTGNDFIYDDDFAQSRAEYDAESGDYDEDGGCLVANPESNGRFHSDWCSMMYPRLLLAKDLLSSDGAVFISIDDNENANLEKICDEVFGEENHLETFHHQVRYGNKSLNERDDFQKLIEYTYIYAKNRPKFKPKKDKSNYDTTKFNLDIKELSEPDDSFVVNGRKVDVFLPQSYSIEKVNDEQTEALSFFKETWITGSIYSGTGHGLMYQKVVEPRLQNDGYGVLYKIEGLGEDGLGFRYMSGPKKNTAKFGKMYTKIPIQKLEGIKAGTYKKESPILNLYDYSADYGNIRHEGGLPFNGGKKPTKMLRYLIQLMNLSDGDLVLDFFSGSASTAHSLMLENEANGANTNFIMIQYPEPCNENSEVFKEGLLTVAEVGKERIRRAGAKIEESNKQLKIGADPNPIPDIGFRVLKIDSSNFSATQQPPELFEQASLDQYADNLKEDRTAEDLLFQSLPAFKIPLSAKIETVELNGKQVFDVNGGLLLACFDTEVDIDTIEQIAKRKPIYAVLRDASLADDSTAANFEELFKTYSPDTRRRVI